MFDRFGPYLDTSIVLTATAEGMSLIYSGQEAGLNKVLAFFEKDEIEWKEHPIADLYKCLFDLKHQNQALWNGNWGGKMVPVPNSAPDAVFSFVRKKADEKVFVVINYSANEQTVTLNENIHWGDYTEWFNGTKQSFSGDSSFTIEPYGYRVFVK